MAQPTERPKLANLILPSVTPLYGFASDADVLVIDDRSRITRFSEERIDGFQHDDVFVDHVRLYQPQYLLWTAVELSQEQVNQIQNFSRSVDGDIWKGGADEEPALLACVQPVSQLLRAFHLFKPGRFIAGDSSFFAPVEESRYVTLTLARCSEMSLDWQFVSQQVRFALISSEIQFLLSFRDRLLQTWPIIEKYSQIELALHRYCKESAQRGDVIELMISLESLLVPEEEGIAFRLAQRVANLLGPDASSRKVLFKQSREFYGLRSRIVHGAKIRRKEVNAAQQVDALREITRRTLLAVMALAADADLNSDS